MVEPIDGTSCLLRRVHAHLIRTCYKIDPDADEGEEWIEIDRDNNDVWSLDEMNSTLAGRLCFAVA